jgi:transcriptional regulator with XRE-family HTH domain
MEDTRIGSVLRAFRIRKGWRQADVAERAGLGRLTVSRLERGAFTGVPIDALRSAARVLEITVDVTPRWRGADLDRLLNRAHASLHESIAAYFRGLPDWTVVPEVSYSIWGERGVIDIVAWHAATRSLLIIELKTILVDPQELTGSTDQRVRLGREIVRDRGWFPRSVSAWVLLTDTRTNRRHLARHAGLLRRAFPSDGRAMRRWLRAPEGAISGLSFLTDDQAVITRRIATRRSGAGCASAERDSG